MKKSIFDEDDPYLEAVRKRRGRSTAPQNRSSRRKRRSLDPNSTGNRLNEFMKQELSSEDFWLIPPEYFGITMFVLFLTTPKVLGMAFFFFYIAGGDSELYRQVHTGGYLLDWAIGYEILAAAALLIILKKLISYVFGK